MSRIHVVEPSTATPEQKVLLDAIQGQLGMVPNFLKVFANSTTALDEPRSRSPASSAVASACAVPM